MSDYIYVGVGDWYGAPAEVPTHGLYRMAAGGDTWQPLGNGLPDTVEVRSIVIQRDAPQNVLVGTQDGPYRSRDAGDSWEKLPLPDGSHVVWSIQPHPTDPDTLFVGTQGTDIFRSRDGGASWRIVHEDARAGAFLDAAAFDGGHGVVFGDAIDGRFVLLETTDGGATWKKCNTLSADEGLLRASLLECAGAAADAGVVPSTLASFPERAVNYEHPNSWNLKLEI